MVSSIFSGILASLVTQMVKNLPTGQETQIRSLGQVDPLEKRMPTHFSILAWRIPWTEKPGGLQFLGCKELDTTEQLILLLSLLGKVIFKALADSDILCFST